LPFKAPYNLPYDRKGPAQPNDVTLTMFHLAVGQSVTNAEASEVTMNMKGDDLSFLHGLPDGNGFFR